MSNFQLIIIGAFVFFIIAGVLVFAVFSGGGQNDSGEVLIWGTMDDGTVRQLIDQINVREKNVPAITYVEKDPRSYDGELIQALAAGSGPDLFFMSDDKILQQKNLAFAIPFESITQREYLNTFLEQGEMFLDAAGTIALPFTIDPLVMYWNRDLLANANVALPPAHWEDFSGFARRLTKAEQNSRITESAVALGEFENVNYAKDIMSTLFLQSGAEITGIGTTGRFGSDLVNATDQSIQHVVSALEYYTSFSNPSASVYSWNRSLPNSLDLFLSSDLAVYFGRASDYAEIINRNPNLNFDVSEIPQLKQAPRDITNGRLVGLAISKSSQNIAPAFVAASYLTNFATQTQLNELTGIPPVRRDLLSNTPTDSINSVFYKASIKARSWFDPEPSETDGIFKKMIEDVATGRVNSSDAVQTAGRELDILIGSISS